MSNVRPTLAASPRRRPSCGKGVRMIWDTFMINNELDMLECRLVELDPIGDLVHIAVEADVDHQDHPKPYHLSENLERFDAWKDRLISVHASGLPTRADFPDPWAREHAQREHIATGLRDASPDDIVLQSDIDEIPTAVAARNVKPQRYVAFEQRGHFWSLRWRYPIPWKGTVAARLRNIVSFGQMRDTRNVAPSIPNAGWHLSWLPNGDLSSAETATKKVGSFCHPEVEDRIVAGLESERFLRDGVHVDGLQMARCEVDATYPRWVREGRCPESWLQ